MLGRIVSAVMLSCLVTVCFGSDLKSLDKGYKTVLVTGGLAGIGKEIALAFKEEGWHVWATSRNPKQYDNIAGIQIRKLDITDGRSIHKLMQEIKRTDGSLDVLVNNAGYGIIGPEEAMSVAQARDLLEINLIAPLQMIQASLPIMRSQGRGHIINISSTSGLRGLPGLGMYAASKMGLEGMSESLAAELAPWNIRVSLIEPGTVNNDWAKNAPVVAHLKEYPEYQKFTENLEALLANKAVEVGQNQKEIGALAVRIANTENPNMRYQTGALAEVIGQEVLVDPTGNTMRDKMIAFSEGLNK